MKKLTKILHIDDDEIMRMMLKKAIERNNQGFEIVSCATATEFIGNLAIFQPDLLIIDVVMPVLDGPSLLAKIRAMPDTTPAIFITGHENLELNNKESLEPILGIIHKPFSPMKICDDLLNMWANLNS
jgi:two-component system OmpR family response regulator